MNKSFKNYTSICTNFRNESDYIYEWVVYHLILGFDRLYLYNHRSDDKYKDILEPFIEKGLVVLNSVDSEGIWPEAYQEKPQQEINYSSPKNEMKRHFFKNYAQDNRWTCFIDMDEYIVTGGYRNIREVMAEFDSEVAVAMVWRDYLSSGIKTKEEGLVLGRFREYSKIPTAIPPIQNVPWFHLVEDEEHWGFKTICNPNVVTRESRDSSSPHTFLYEKQAKAVTENHDTIPDGTPVAKMSYNKIFVAHYKWKSLEEYMRRRFDLPRDDSGKYKESGDRQKVLRDNEWLRESIGKKENRVYDRDVESMIAKIKKFNIDNFRR